MELRPYETDWLRRIHALQARSLLLVGPTGVGKTVVAVQLLRSMVELGLPVLFVVHRRELLTQAVARLRVAGVPESDLGVVAGFGVRGHGERPDAPVKVATIQTLVARKYWPAAELVIVDEAHRITSQSYQDLLAHYPRARVCGLTATPFRLDGAPLGEVFDVLVPSAPPSELIEAGWLAKPRVWTVPQALRPSLGKIRRRAGDYARTPLGREMARPPLVGSVLDHYVRLAQGRPTVVFAVNIRHGLALQDRFRAAGVGAEFVDGRTPPREREKILAEVALGRVPVVISCGVLVEGWDCPPIKCALIARPTLSASIWFQMCGRVTRPYGRWDPIVVDHAGNALIHGLPLEDEAMALDQRRAGPGPHAAGERECPKCSNTLVGITRVCTWCGYVLYDGQSIPAELRALLEPVERVQVRCGYAECPTPHRPVRFKNGPSADPVHFVCRQLRAAQQRRFCAFPECPTPDQPLSPQNRGGMHRGCGPKSKGRATKVRRRCEYEACPRPDELFWSKPQARLVMHGECLTQRARALRRCQYAHCQEPELLLGGKAGSHGTTMHRVCAARARSERVAPDQPRCGQCRAVERSGSGVELQHLEGAWWCVACRPRKKRNGKTSNKEN